MKSFPQCEQYTKNTKIVLQDSKSKNKCKICFLNPKREKILTVKVDGCIFTDDATLRCDYALVSPKQVEIYIELKGNDVYHAVKQIEATIAAISSDSTTIKKLCFIVSSRVPKQTTSIQQLQARFKKKFNASLRIKNVQDEYDLSTL
ncbi:hypothetical protein [Oscillatoria sp. FACHB-1406]|uniref:hypothetical protein n=1 Tax=Oscillatoria sp. FACHB-1406 TaxID=2692846 RepID=UPI0016821161|nr:hypothetical protein [Oscillatoria sp. FACHB-1406]MBD2580275.1 hypothetical protein [Oscillatoria sp. FACHB-1406]